MTGIENNATGSPKVYDPVWSIANITVPDSLVNVFSSGTRGPGNTVSGAFDIQPRQFQLRSSGNIIDGSPLAVSNLPSLGFVLLNDKIEAVEGLVVDTRKGNVSVGFRNHTLPMTGGNPVFWNEVRLSFSNLKVGFVIP